MPQSRMPQMDSPARAATDATLSAVTARRGNAAGNVTQWDTHGFGCAICVDVARETMQLYNSGADVQSIRASIERLYSGADNAFKVAILELGMKMQTFSVNPEESQLIETRKEQAVQTCMLYNVPPHKIGILDRATFSNIEQQGIDYVTGPISSLAQNIESAIEIACLTPEERSLYSVRHNLDALMRGDILSRYRAYAIGRQWGWLSADDVRGFEDMNRLPDDQGKVYLSPMNMVPADQQDPALDPSQDPPPDNADPAPPGNDARRRAALTAARRINGFSKLLLGPDGNPWRH